MIKANRLARAVAHWTGFESACDRESLLSEASLAIPVGQCLKAMLRKDVVPKGSGADFKVVPEFPYETLRGDADFVLRLREEPQTLLDLIEMKIVRASKRNISQEIFEDILRLESVPNPHGTGHPLGRWLLIAGTWEDIQYRALDAEGNEGGGGGRVKLFGAVLPKQVNKDDNAARLQVDIENSLGAVRRYWGNAQRLQGLQSIPHVFLIDLRGIFPPEPKPKHYTCLVWRILRSTTRRPIDLHGETPPADAVTCTAPLQAGT